MCVVFNQPGKLAAGCHNLDQLLLCDFDFWLKVMLEGAQLVVRAEENPGLFDKAMQLLVNRLC